MLLIDVLALVAEEQLARLREEEERQKEMQQRAEPVKVRRIKRAKRGNLVVSSSDENGDDDDGGGHGNGKAVTVFTRESNLKLKVKIEKNCDDGSAKKEEGKTETVSTPDLPTKLKNNKRNLTELDNGTDQSPDKLTTSQNKKRKPEADNGPDPPSGLPPKFKDMILEKAQGEPVEEAVLVIQKKLTHTDMKNHQNRLSIPLNQTRNSFLNEEDERFIEGRDAKGKCNVLGVDIIEPEGEVRSVHLTRWVMRKLSGKPSISYVLNGKGWKKIKACNHLKVDDVVQLWSVQIRGKTCLVFVKVEKETIIP